MTSTSRTLAFLIVALASIAAPAVRGEVAPEPTGQIEPLGDAFAPHRVWVSDLVLERAALIDLDERRYLGQINGGYGSIAPMFSLKRSEIYVPATYYSRRSRGERTDVLEIHDGETLSPIAEVKLPPGRAIDAVPMAHAAMSDDERFVAVFNWQPRPSLSIVDVERRTFVGQVGIPGCALAYAGGDRRFMALCADGSFLAVTLDDEGREVAKERTEPFFDPQTDPVTEKAVRLRDRWLFVTFAGMVHPVDVSGPRVVFREPWSLFTESERDAAWKIGGWQHLAVHEVEGRLYSLVHRGEADTHKSPGEEIWVYDLETRERLQRIELRSPGVTVYGFPVEFGRAWIWPFNRLSDWLVDTFVPAAVSHIQVTQDSEPLLFTVSQFSGSIGTYDALTGDFVGRVAPVGWTCDLLLAPWGRPPEVSQRSVEARR